MEIAPLDMRRLEILAELDRLQTTITTQEPSAEREASLRVIQYGRDLLKSNATILPPYEIDPFGPLHASMNRLGGNLSLQQMREQAVAPRILEYFHAFYYDLCVPPEHRGSRVEIAASLFRKGHLTLGGAALLEEDRHDRDIIGMLRLF